MEDRTLKLKNYIEEISLIHDRKPFDMQAAKDCLKKYELTEEEEQQLFRISSGHKKRSEELLRAKNLNGAIISMERAVEIHPLSDEYRNHMAQLYLMRANREGYKKTDRDRAFKSAEFSLQLKKNNPIASSIIKEIKRKDSKISGNDLNRKLILPLMALFIIIVTAIFIEKPFNIPFLFTKIDESEKEWIKPPEREIQTFSTREIDVEINSSLNREFEVLLNKSVFEKINGSYAYTLQGEIQAPEKALSSADLDVNFINSENISLFKKKFPLIREDQMVLPGESIVIDEFFYIHYLPPDIERINLNLSNISFSENFVSNDINRDVYLQWNAGRPEGTKIQFVLKKESTIPSYSGSYKNMKIMLKNIGGSEIYALEAGLSWKDKYGRILLISPEILISEYSPSLLPGKNRIYHFLTEIPEEISEITDTFYITIDRIN